jgi:hypothetical protein
VVPRTTTAIHYAAPQSDLSDLVTITLRLSAVAGYRAPTGRVSADEGFHCQPLVVGAVQSTAKCHLVVPQNTSETVILHYGGDATYAATDGAADVSVGGW